MPRPRSFRMSPLQALSPVAAADVLQCPPPQTILPQKHGAGSVSHREPYGAEPRPSKDSAADLVPQGSLAQSVSGFVQILRAQTQPAWPILIARLLKVEDSAQPPVLLCAKSFFQLFDKHQQPTLAVCNTELPVEFIVCCTSLIEE